MDKPAVALLFGGRSSEHSISSATAGGVLGAIDRDRYRVIPIGITREGAFVLEDDEPAKFALKPERLPEVVDNGTRIVWPDSAASRELRVRDAGGERSLGDVDVVFPILHGRYGEDGTVQGMLELLGLPYVGAGVLMSALGMDKHAAKSILAAAGVPVVPWLRVTPADQAGSARSLHARAAELGYPVFVKPSRAGSSVGVSKASDAAELDAALRTAFEHDSVALVERAVRGRELECGVLAGVDGGPPRVSAPGEIVVRGREFYDFAAKYLDAPGVELICPATVSDSEWTRMRRIASDAFVALGGEGLARVDFFLEDGRFYVNELNTMPGFTPISMFPACWIASGMSYADLITDLVESGIRRG